MIENIIPDIYQKSIYYINFDKLYKKGIRCIIFDLDNTLTPAHINKPTKRQKRLIDELRDKGFKIIIMSNAPKHRIEPFKSYLNVDACAFSLKPRKNKYEKIMENLLFFYWYLRILKNASSYCFTYSIAAASICAVWARVRGEVGVIYPCWLFMMPAALSE